MPSRLRTPLEPEIVPPLSSGPPRTGTRAVYVVRAIGPGEIVAIAFLTAVIVLSGILVMFWAFGARVVFAPTPTPTPTVAPSATPTADFRATRVSEDMLTQEAYQAVLSGTPTLPPPTTTPPAVVVVVPGDGVVVPTPTVTPTLALLLPGVAAPGPGVTPAAVSSAPPIPAVGQPQSPIATAPITSVVSIPILSGGSPLATPPPPPAAALPTPAPVDTPPVAPTDTPAPLPVLPADTPTPVATPTPIPPSPSPTAAPTGIAYQVNSLNATTRETGATGYLDGPSTIFTDTRTLGPNSPVTLLGRTPSGEWVYACCVEGRPLWVRQAFVRIEGNTLQPNAPEGANPNDARWLTIQPAPLLPAQLPPPTPIPDGTFPLYRYTRDARARLPRIPGPQLAGAWTGQTAGPLTSPAAVAGSSVLVASADGHLYSFDRDNGNQRWRFQLAESLVQPPTILDGRIYLATAAGRFTALEDRGNEAVPLWSVSGLGQPPVTSFNIFSDTLFIGVGAPNSYQLAAVDRDDGALLRTYPVTGQSLRYPAIGDQLIYVAGDQIVALDVLRIGADAEIWKRPDLGSSAAGPVYAAPGVRGLAELYVVTSGNRIFCLDANTGAELWNLDNGEAATGLAVSADALLVAGNGYVKAIDRNSLQQRWRVDVPGAVVAGPWTDDTRALILTEGGSLTSVDLVSGATVAGANIPAPPSGGAAISAPWVFIPGRDGNLYARREGP
jgi:outer membrane protein assembly factor BamB